MSEQTEAAFGKDLWRLYPNIKKAKRGPKGEQGSVYLGIESKFKAS